MPPRRSVRMNMRGPPLFLHTLAEGENLPDGGPFSSTMNTQLTLRMSAYRKKVHISNHQEKGTTADE